MSPSITLKENIYTIALVRDSKPVVYEFTRRYHLIIYHANERSLAPSYREKILGPAFDGIIYWIDVSFPGERHFIWISKDEFEVLQPMMEEIDWKEYQKI
jgi:hypothetical protein